jgi:hypothetical protein
MAVLETLLIMRMGREIDFLQRKAADRYSRPKLFVEIELFAGIGRLSCAETEPSADKISRYRKQSKLCHVCAALASKQATRA